MEINKTGVILFLKLPEKGKVKTRLSESTSEKFAIDFYKLCVSEILKYLNLLNKSEFDIYVFFENDKNKRKIMEWLGSHYNLITQRGDYLGERMLNSFRYIFSKGYGRAVIIGSDIPDLSNETIEQAAALLNEHDVIISPSTDGGYVLLGLKKIAPELFENISWSTGEVLQQTIDKIKNAGLSYKLTNPLSDIDDKNDLLNWFEEGKNLSLIKQIQILYNKEITP
jgi:hypothetical protein